MQKNFICGTVKKLENPWAFLVSDTQNQSPQGRGKKLPQLQLAQGNMVQESESVHSNNRVRGINQSQVQGEIPQCLIWILLATNLRANVNHYRSLKTVSHMPPEYCLKSHWQHWKHGKEKELQRPRCGNSTTKKQLHLMFEQHEYVV